MKKNETNIEERSIEDFNSLIESIKKASNLNEEQISVRMGYNEGYISQTRSRGKVPVKLFNNLQREFRNELIAQGYKEKNTAKPIEVQEPEADYGQPIIQVVLNLSYTSKKNADSMDKMAATNQRNTEIIAALVQTLIPNSKLDAPPTPELDDLSKQDEEVPSIEEMLGPAGIALLKQQWQAGKTKQVNK